MVSREQRKQWLLFFCITIVLLLLPYSIEFDSTMFSIDIFVQSILYTYTNTVQPFVILSSLSVIRVINLLLILIPILYFTYRRLYQAEGESLELLGVIMFLLTMIVVGILDFQAFYSFYQRDTLYTPTPNFNFLPSFALLMLEYHVLVPLIKEHLSNPTSLDGERYTFSSRISRLKDRFPKTAFGWIMFIFLFFPSIVFIELSSLILNISSISFETYTSLFQISYDFVMGNRIDAQFGLYVGGYTFIEPIIYATITSVVYVLSIPLYLGERITRRQLVFIALLSVVPSLFFTFYSLVLVLCQVSYEVAIPLPLVQLGGMLVVHQVERTRNLDAEGEFDMRSREIIVPFGYLIRSLFRRGKEQKLTESFDNEHIATGENEL